MMDIFNSRIDFISLSPSLALFHFRGRIIRICVARVIKIINECLLRFKRSVRLTLRYVFGSFVLKLYSEHRARANM